MIIPALAIAACWIVLGLMGLGPALWLVSHAENRPGQAAAMAVPVGLALLSIVGYPLTCYLVPVSYWAWPAAAALAAVSLGLAGAKWRTSRALAQAVREQRPGAAWAAAMLLVAWALLAAPLIWRGIQFGIFRSNPSDAFVYMTLAETLRVAPWPTLTAGLTFTQANWEALGALAQASPTALFSARFVAYPFFLGHPANLAWVAEITRQPIHAIYYAFSLLNCLAAFPAALAIGRQLNLPRALNLLAGGAIAAGFWTRFVLERDAGFQIGGLPLLCMTLYAWIDLEQRPARIFSPGVALLAISLAALICICLPMGVVLAGGMAVYYGLALVQGRLAWVRIAALGLAGVLAVGVLGVTGQLGYVLAAARYSVSLAPGISSLKAETLELMRAQGLAALWGLPLEAVWSFLPGRYLWPLAQLAGLLAAGVTVLAALAGAFGLRRETPAPQRIVLASVIGAAGIAAGYALTQNDRAADKLFTYSAPLVILLGAAGVQYAGRVLQPRARTAAQWAAAGWLGGTMLLGAALPPGRGLALMPPAARSEQYDLRAISLHLPRDGRPLVLVNVPRTNGWTFPLYIQLALGRQNVYFQSGLVIDNNSDYQNLYFEELDEVPRYALMLKSADYVGAAGLGDLAAETQDLALYRLTTTDVAELQAFDAAARAAEAAKPAFPSLAP